jgi:copper chaperone CopZ
LSRHIFGTLRLTLGDKPMQDITLTISGMSCGHCLNAVNQAISTVQGVEIKSVKIGRADLRVPGDGAAEQVKAAIQEAGYKVEGSIA